MACHAKVCMKDEVGVIIATITGCFNMPAGEKEENGLRELKMMMMMMTK